MADHSVNLGVNQLLGDDGALLRIGLVVLCDKIELDLGATDFEALSIQLVNCHTGAVLVVFTQMGLRTCQRRDVAKFNRQLWRRWRYRSGNRSGMAVNILKQNGITDVYNGGSLENMQFLLN